MKKNVSLTIKLVVTFNNVNITPKDIIIFNFNTINTHYDNVECNDNIKIFENKKWHIDNIEERYMYLNIVYENFTCTLYDIHSIEKIISVH